MVPGVARRHGLAIAKLVGAVDVRSGAVARTVALAVLAVLATLVLAAHAMADTDTYSETQTIPVPPASNYSGSGGGDGWAVALSDTQVFNVLHHSGSLNVVCHNQVDASPCWPSGSTTRTITDENGNNFATSGQPGVYFDKSSGKLYTYATRSSDSTAGVVCIDTTQAPNNPNPFCGYTPLTAPLQGPIDPSGISGVSVPMQVGDRWYAFNYVNSANAVGDENKLLCFDLTTFAACSGQPFAVNIGLGLVSDGGFPSPATAAIGTRVVIPLNFSDGSHELACFDDSTQANCSGSWPVPLNFSYPASNGSPFPMLDSTGALLGLCLPTGTDQCFNLDGSTAATPAGMSSVIGGSSPWNGPAFVLGPRVYVPDGNADRVECYDYSTSAGCANFPKSFNNLGYLYTVNPDPQRPTCIWVNADDGSAQIQNFDAYTPDQGCGQGSVRVLAAQFVVNQQKCRPNSYQSLQVLTPDRGSYSDGSIQFEDGDGNPIPGAGPRPIDGTGTVDLTGLNLNTPTGLPQFLITLNGESGAPGKVVVKLTWTAAYDPACIKPTYQVQRLPTRTTTALSGAGQTGANITVPAGTAVTDQATLTGDHASAAGGTIQYSWYSDSSCTNAVSTGAAQPLNGPNSVPPSAPLTFNNPGTYYARATYSGDKSNFGSGSNCGDESVTVQPAGEPAPWTLTISLRGTGGGTVRSSPKGISCRPTCAQSYPAGTRVVLTADPRFGSAFTGWSGGGCKGTGTCIITLNANTVVTATFDKRKAPQLRLNSGSGGISVSPAELNCEGELTFIRAAATCTLARVRVAGKIAKNADGFVSVRIYSWFGKREARGKISNGHWRVDLDVPGINVDPVSPKYLIVVHYRGGRVVHAGTVSRLVRIEVEQKGLGPG